MPPSPAAAADDCEHHYASRILGGQPISVRACTFCHTPDWQDLADQAMQLYQWGRDESLTGKPPRETLSAYDMPRDDTPAATEATQPPTSPLRDQVAAALLARIKQATVKPALPSSAPYASLFAANEFDLADAALSVVLPHGKSLGDELRDSEQRLAETRTVLDEVLRAFVHKGHPGEPCLQTGWIAVGTVERWRAVLYPPVPEGS